jgi:diguanylate cyclase (GGDEF)-like protein
VSHIASNTQNNNTYYRDTLITATDLIKNKVSEQNKRKIDLAINGAVDDFGLVDALLLAQKLQREEEKQQHLEFRLQISEIQRTIKQLSISPNLTKKQSNILQSIKINEKDLTKTIVDLSKVTKAFAEDVILTRESGEKIVNHIENKTQKNVISGDVFWIGKQLIQLTNQALKSSLRTISDNDNKNKIETLLNNGMILAKETKPDIFSCVNHVEEAITTLTLLEQSKAQSEFSFLESITEALKSIKLEMQKSLADGRILSSTTSEKQKEIFSVLNAFSDATKDEDDPITLRETINKNILLLKESVGDVLETQNNYIKQQEQRLNKLNGLIKSQEEDIKRFEEQKTKMNELIHEAKQSAITDNLTKIKNRRAFDDDATKIEYTVSSLAPLKKRDNGIILIDADYFKKINDTYGHKAGDQVLIYIAKTIELTIKKLGLSDKVSPYRYGGEEFALIYQDLPLVKALKLAESLRLLINKRTLSLNENKFKISVSLGLATFTMENTLVKDVFSIADNNLYKAKNHGRNCIVYQSNNQSKRLNN